jgi:arginase
LSLLGIPLYTQVKYRGMGLAVGALRRLGLPEILQKSSSAFSDLGDVTVPEIKTDSGPSNIRNFDKFLESTKNIRAASSGISEGDFVFCLGGECGLIVGTLAGFRGAFKGRPGVLWLDAHGDFNTPETTPSGFIGGMPLAIACGRGPKLFEEIDELQPLVSEEAVVHMGSRDLDPPEAEAMKKSPLKLYPAAYMRKEGISKSAEEAARHLDGSADWVICHLDLDVIDPSTIPAVDFPCKEGLRLEEVLSVVQAVQKTGKMKVFNLTAYDPTLDTGQQSGRIILNLIMNMLVS